MSRVYYLGRDRNGDVKLSPRYFEGAGCTVSAYELMEIDIQNRKLEAWLKAQGKPNATRTRPSTD